MKSINEYIQLLAVYMQTHASVYHIKRMGIFGSVARGEQTENSDIDICYEGEAPTLFTLVRIKYELEALLGRPVDLVRVREKMDEVLKQPFKRKLFMYDVKVLHLLDKVIESLEVIQQRTENIHCTNDFLDSATGTLLLDGVCMKLIATGESIKNLDKLTAGNLLIYYPQIPWREVMGMRDIIVHHYFEVDADVIFNTVKENIPLLMDTLLQMREDLKE